MGFQTECIAGGEDREEYQGSIAPPIYQSSLFAFPTVEAFERSTTTFTTDCTGRPFYSRVGNPTVRALERKVALLEGTEAARAFGSGMAAIAAAIMSCVKAGGHIVAVRSIYSTAYTLLRSYLPDFGVGVTFADFTSLDTVEAAIRPNTTALYLESPGNPGMHLVDLASVVDLARRRGLTTIFDNSMATPFNQRPAEWGIDLIVHSATKYLGGHSDVVAGIVAGSEERMNGLTANELNDLGGILGPFDAWLLLRGIRTLGVRMKAHNESALCIAGWLEARPEVERVMYPGLASHPQRDLAERQMTGYSGILALVLRGGRERAVRVADALQLFSIGVSWGGFESLVIPYSPPALQEAELNEALGLTPGLLRLSIGLEDTEDLLEDLEHALQEAYSD